MDWFLYNADLRYESVKMFLSLPLLACDLSASVKENPDRKKDLSIIQEKRDFGKILLILFSMLSFTYFGKYLFLLKGVCNYSFFVTYS